MDYLKVLSWNFMERLRKTMKKLSQGKEVCVAATLPACIQGVPACTLLLKTDPGECVFYG
jgi:hypothetical protein